MEELRSNNIITHDSDIEKYGTNGWDYGRLVYLTRLCYDAQYITEQEAWQFIDSAYASAKASFKSWDTYAKSYVIGRSLWGGEDAANEGIMQIAEYLQKEPRSPWVQMTW